jgi:hypothetical protein
MKNQWQKLICIGLALVTLSLTAIACPSPGSTSDNGKTETTVANTQTTAVSTEVPVVDIERVADNNLDLPGRTVVALATPDEGALLINGDVRLYVPPNAVSETTPVTVKLCTGTPEPATPPSDDTPQVVAISSVYDLGPEGIEFNQPVTVTIPYDPSLLPAGADENSIGMVYYNGQNWVPIERQIDTDNNLLSFQTKSFPGTLLAAGAAFLPSGPVGWGVLAAVTVVAVVAWSVATPNIKSQAYKDPIYWGKAGNYVTPDDATVAQYAKWAQVNINGETKPVKLEDLLKNPDALKKLAANTDSSINFNDGTGVFKPNYVTTENPKDWQMPADYFKNGLNGDCKNVANAYASMFRHYNYDVMCVDGFMGGDRHVWAEVKVDGRPYYVGSDGEFLPLDKAISDLKLTRPTPNKDGQGYMWDETGQKPYKSNWWVNKLTLTVDTTMTFPGGQAVVEVFGAVGVALDINLNVAGPDNKQATYSGTTDTSTGKVKITVPLAKNAPIGTYLATATNDVNKLSEMIGFCVDTLEISAGVYSSTVAPGEDLVINVMLSKPLVTNIAISDASGSWPTDKNGAVSIKLNIPENTKLMDYTRTVSAPQFGVSTKVKYTVTIPPTLKVEIQNKEVAPGGTLNVKVTVQPPQATRITIRGYDTTWVTDSNGIANIQLSVLDSAQPGQYQITVEAKQLELSESDTYTVTLIPSSQIGLGDINAVSAELDIKVDGSNNVGDYEDSLLLIGGQFVHLDNILDYQINASGTVQNGSGQGEMTYSFTLSKDLSKLISGSMSLFVPATGESFSVNFFNVLREPKYETQLKEERGLDCLVYTVIGTDVTNFISGLNISSDDIGTITRYFAQDDSQILIVLVAATDAQLTQLLEES